MKSTHRWITTTGAATALALVTAVPVVYGQATDPAARAPVTDTNRAPVTDTNTDGEDVGNWGWLGLLGLVGLAGLMRGNREHTAGMHASTTAAR